jgi:hypothetical protein
VASTYGWSHPDILKLSARQFFMYLNQIPIIEARQQMMRFESSLLPYQESDGVKSMIKPYQETLEIASGPKASTKEDVDFTWDMLRKGVTPNG